MDRNRSDSEISQLEIDEAQSRARTTGTAQLVFSRDGSRWVLVTSVGPNQVIPVTKSGGTS